MGAARSAQAVARFTTPPSSRPRRRCCELLGLREVGRQLLEQVVGLLHAALHAGFDDRVTDLLAETTVRTVSVVRPSRSVSELWFRLGSESPSGMPSKTSVCTIRSGTSISRYSPWKATSNPSFAVMT